MKGRVEGCEQWTKEPGCYKVGHGKLLRRGDKDQRRSVGGRYISVVECVLMACTRFLVQHPVALFLKKERRK